MLLSMVTKQDLLAGSCANRRAQHVQKPLGMVNWGLHPTEIAQSGA